MSLLQNGNFGIGTQNPSFLLDVAGRIRLQTQSDGNTAGLWLNNPANTSAIGFMGIANTTTMGFYGNTAGWGLAMNTNTGNVGINTLAPVNRLQIGSMGGVGFNGNDFALGNGTNATGFFQSNSNLQVTSSTNIALMPGNGTGRIGINTSIPRAPLDVVNNVSVANPNTSGYYAYYTVRSDLFGGYTHTGSVSANTLPNVSIFASDRIVATEFDAYSDARIKNTIGRSSSAKDLDIINQISITDYAMKDKVVYGNSLFKKVIAQEVEKVYPQVVSKHKDFIPNVYQVTSKIEETTTGYLFTFSNKHNIGNNAQKLRMLLPEGKGMEAFDIVSIPSDNKVIVKIGNGKYDKVFVYGEEVDDFRTVDYEGLTTLNISATQELSKLVKQQQAAIDVLGQELKLLKEKNVSALVTKNDNPL